jgi:hypothetical protein
MKQPDDEMEAVFNTDLQERLEKLFVPALKLGFIVRAGVCNIDCALFLHLVTQRKLARSEWRRYNKTEFMRMWGVKNRKNAERALQRMREQKLIEVRQDGHGKLVKILAADGQIFHNS